jgi:hypothetical protein
MALLLVTSAARADMYTIETSGEMRLDAKHKLQTCKYGEHEFQPGDTVVQVNGNSRLSLICAKTDVGGMMYMISASEVVAATRNERHRILRERAARYIRE